MFGEDSELLTSRDNHFLWLWVPDQRALEARLSGTTAEVAATSVL
jgi:hypothetical protein